MSASHPFTPSEIDRLATWMSANGLGSGPLSELQPLGGGTQNVMARFTRDGEDYVLRRGPRHLRAASNAVILRETQVLRALADTDVPHPHLIATCAATDLDHGAVFDGAVCYLMAPVDGFNASQELPSLHAEEPVLQRRMCESIIDALVALGRVDHHRVGLVDFGRPEGFLERQVPRWRRELESYASTCPGYAGVELPGLDELAAWLTSHRPRQWTPGIMHGDFHAANVMFSRTGPEVAAIVDWEMATIGDPLLDLGWLIATWQLPGAPSIFGGPFMTSPHLASTRDLTEHYASKSTRNVADIDWYVAMACFKLGILLEGTHARAWAGLAPRETGSELHEVTLALFERGLAVTRGRW